jgi:hypothetical protein
MGWRDRMVREGVIKTLVDAAGKRQDLPMDMFHGTKRVFPEFKQWDVKDAYTIDRALGTHTAPDVNLSTSFADVPQDLHLIPANMWDNMRENPHIIPLKGPPDEAYLRAEQPIVSGREDDPLWKRVRTDTSAMNIMASKEAYKQDPDLLTLHLVRDRHIPPAEAKALSRAMIEGYAPTISGASQDLDYFLRNYGPISGDISKQRVVDLARQSWQDQGYAGIKYINTAPMEAGAPGVKDTTSYITFDPADLRSRFATMSGDIESMKSRNLMRGAVGGAPLAGLYNESQYEVPNE